MDTHEVDVLIVGGGPAGMLLGLLLGRQGVKTLVVERHADFAREYRGEVLMPRFTQILRALGLEERIERGIHRRLETFEFWSGSRPLARVPVARACPEVPYAIWMPQPVLLQNLLDAAAEFPSFEMWFGTDARELLDGGGRCAGARVRRDGMDIEVRARITVGADGRFSKVRRLGGFEVAYEKHDFDVLWFTIPEPEGWPAAFRAFLGAKRSYIALPKHPASVQCGMVIPPGAFTAYRDAGIEVLRRDLLEGPALIHDFARGCADFEPFVLLQARLDMIRTWAKDGLLLIGDAAHTCSPVGAVGVAVAIHTAAVAAEVIPHCLARDDLSARALGEVQSRRETDVRAVHRLQMRLAGPLTTFPRPIRQVLAGLLRIATRLGWTPTPLLRLAPLSRPYEPDKALVFDAAQQETAEAGGGV